MCNFNHQAINMDKCPNMNKYCYVCGLYIPSYKKKIYLRRTVAIAYQAYFRLQVIRTPYAPSSCCIACYYGLTNWFNFKASTFVYKTPMIWRPTDYFGSDCYACQTTILDDQDTCVFYSKFSSSTVPTFDRESKGYKKINVKLIKSLRFM